MFELGVVCVEFFGVGAQFGLVLRARGPNYECIQSLTVAERTT